MGSVLYSKSIVSDTAAGIASVMKGQVSQSPNKGVA